MPERFGPYVLLKRLGGGAMGDAHLARPVEANAGLPSPLVIKRLHGELALKDDFVRRFKHEAEIATMIDSPHVARIYDVGRVGDTLYIAMEYVSGWSLARVIDNLAVNRDRASLLSAIDVVSGTLLGLGAIHAARDHTGAPLGIVHRDISPKNLIVGEDGLTRVIDLGLGKSRLQDWKTRTGALMGTMGYMAPEQVTGGIVDHRADLFAAGVVLWELLTGVPYIVRESMARMLLSSASPPFRPAVQFRSDIPAQLDAVLERALAIDASRRFQSAGEFHAALRRAVPSPEAQRPEVWTLIGQMLWTELSSSRIEVKALLDSDASSDAETIVDQRTQIFSRRPPDQTLIKDPPTILAPGPPPVPPSSPWLKVGAAIAGVAAVGGAVIMLLRRPEEHVPVVEPIAAVPQVAPSVEARAAVVPPAPEPARVESKVVAPRQRPVSPVSPASGAQGARGAEDAQVAAADRTPVRAAGSMFDRTPGESPRAWLDRLIAASRALRERAEAGSEQRQKLELISVQLTRLRLSKQLDREVGAIGVLAGQLAEHQ